MRWPWISRSSHEETVKLLQEQIAEMRAERKILYDRLAAMGLGGPLFHIPASPEEEPEPEELVDPQAEINEILANSRRPNLMAQMIRRRAMKEAQKRGPSVKWIPRGAESVMSQLDEIEAEGKKQA
jgi:hypothetical protein